MTPVGLREEQQDIVNSVLTRPVTVVSAGAGTGKTFTTVAAVLALLEHGDGDDFPSLDQFVLITFSRKAAGELRSRLGRALNRRAAEARKSNPKEARYWRSQCELLSSAYIGTIHAFCWRLLRVYGYHEHVAREAGISLSRTKLKEAFLSVRQEIISDPSVMQDLQEGGREIAEYQLEKLVLALIDFARNRDLCLETLSDQTATRPVGELNRNPSVAMAKIAVATGQAYDKIRRQAQVLDAHDLLHRMRALLIQPEVAKRIANRHKYLFVDEFQDTDAVQMDFLRALKPHLKRLIVVGDKKQSIYYFRGARQDFLEQAAREFNVHPPLPLRTSGRARQELLKIQNALFQSMEAQGWVGLDEPLVSDLNREARSPNSPYPSFLFIIASTDLKDQAARIQETLSQVKAVLDVGFKPGEIALLFRSNQNMLRYLDVLRGDGLPARASLGESFYSLPEVIGVYRILRLVLNRDDDAALALALESPWMTSARDVEIERQIMGGRHRYATLGEWFAGQVEGTPQARVRKILDGLRSAMLKDPVPAFLGRIYRDFDAASIYAGESRVLSHLDHIRDLARTSVDVEQALTLRDFTDLLQLRIATEAREEEIDPPPPDHGKAPLPPYIRLMTVHGSKGLEFPVVIVPEVQSDLVRSMSPPEFVVSMEDPPRGYGLDLRPPSKSGPAWRAFSARVADTLEARLDEEMRLLYVAATRAQESLILVGAGSGIPAANKNTRYAWQDEILQAKSRIERLGGVYRQ